MSTEHVPIPPVRNISVDAPSLSSSTSSSLWDRLSDWVSENKAVVYTVGAVAIVVTGAGVVYLLSESNKGLDSGSSSEEKRKSKKDRRKAKKQPVEEPKSAESDAPRKIPAVEVEKDLPEVDETTVETLSAQERKDYAAKLKAAGNKAYGSKNYNEAIELYGKAILCKPDPIFYSNRAACYNALGEWQMVVDDTTSALQLDPEYVKALNRRANAYERVERYSEALLDYTASCIIDGFKNEASAHSVERLLKKVAEAKGKAILAEKEKVLPSPTFVTNYLQSFRPRPLPEGLDETADLDEESGKGQLRAGLVAVGLKTADGYDKAAKHFEKALELGDLGEYEAFAYNMRGTFKYLRGDSADALVDLTKSVELQPSLTQSFIKRASMHLELEGDREAATADFTQAMTQNADDPDIYYHRAQLHFICGEYPDAAKDYQKSIDLDKEFIFSHIQLGVTQYKMGSVASSMATFRRCIKNFDKVPDVYNYYGELLLDQQKYQEAIEKFDTAVEMEKQSRFLVHMNVLPLINKALALFQWKKDFGEAEKLCQKALIIDPECDIAVATMAQLLLQQGKVPDALKYFERAAELSRTEGEIVNALSYAEATRTQLEAGAARPVTPGAEKVFPLLSPLDAPEGDDGRRRIQSSGYGGSNGPENGGPGRWVGGSVGRWVAALTPYGLALYAVSATVTLTAVNFPDEHSPRVLKLTPSASIVKIGRASKSASKNLHPGPNNAWFDSPVISREHAQLSLVQNPKSVSLTDIGSMHGTKIDGKQLKEKEIHKIASDQTMTFGSEIARGLDVFPPRQFKVHIEWDDWSPPTPISSSPITNSPNRAYGIADDDLMISSEEGTSDGGSFVEKSPSIPVQGLHSYQRQTAASVACGSTFIVPDSEPPSPCPRNSDCGTRERDRVHVRVQELSDLQEQVTQPRDAICCRAELVDIEFSGPTGLTEEEKAEDEGLFLTTNSAERLFNRYSVAGSTSSSPRRQAKDITIIDLVEETGDASDPVVIDETVDQEGVNKINCSRPSLWDNPVRPALGQDIKEDEEYSPPPASAYGNESCGDSDYEMEVPIYESGSDEDGSKEALDEDLVSEDEFDNEGWSRPVSDHDEGVFDYYDEPSEAEDGVSDDDMEEASSQHGPEPSKLSVMTEAMKALEEDSIGDFANTLKNGIAGSPSRTPPAAPTVFVEGSQTCASNTSCPAARELSHPNTQYQGTTCSLPPIQKMKVSEALSPICFPHDLPPKPRAPSPSDAAMVKTPSIQANLNAHPIPKLRFGEPLPQNHSISTETHEAIDNEAHSSNGNRAELTAPTSGVGRVGTPDSLRAVNARKLGELSGKSEFFQAREANRREVFPIEPEMPTAPQPIMANTKVSPTSDLDYLFCFEPASKCEPESQDTNSQRHSGVFRDFASTASEAGSFAAADELFSLPYTADSARQGEFRDTGYSNVTSAAGLRKDFENWMKEKDMDDFNPGPEATHPPGGVRIPQEGQELVSSSRVSIRNIVDPVGEVPSLKAEATRPYGLPYAGAKRKADEISSLDVANAHRPEFYQEQPQPGVFDDFPMTEAHPRGQDEFTPLEALVSSDSPLQCEITHADDPPSKRVKFTAEPKRSGVAKFAATALAGAVIGGIGVFAALVASAPSA